MRKKHTTGWILLTVIVGAIMGSVMGQVIAFVLPDGVVKEFFLRSIVLGFSPTTIDLALFTFTLGLSFQLNIIGVIGIILAVNLFRWYT